MNIALIMHNLLREILMMNKDTLVFSIALNGYQWRYQRHLKSHLAFAQRFGYHYQVVTRPFFSKLGIECCWLKLTLMHTALLAGYKYVVFLDADAFVQPRCPEITTIIDENKYLYMAKGYSKRFNSGVMIVKNSAKVRQWLMHVINRRTVKVHAENDVGWGENSHIIEHSHDCDLVKELPQQWNNTFDIHLDDFIRHQNFGPLRTGVLDNLLHKIIFSVANRTMRFYDNINALTKTAPITDLLMSETKKVITIYPCFCHTPPKTRFIKSYNPLNLFKS